MASYDAVIKLVVQGEDALKRIQDRVDKLYKTIDDLERKKKFAGSEAAVKYVREQANELERVLVVSKQIIRQDEQRIIQQSKLNSAVDLYERRLQQTVNSGAAGLKKFEGQIKEIEAAFKFFKDRGNVTAVQALATELGRMVEYSNNVNRNERARFANQSKIFEYTKKINEYEERGLKVAEAREKFAQFAAVSGTNQLNEAKKYEEALKRKLSLLEDEYKQQVKTQTGIVKGIVAEETARKKADEQRYAAQQRFMQLTEQAHQQALANTEEYIRSLHRTEAARLRELRIAKLIEQQREAAGPAQLLLPAAAPGAPAMSGGARRLITGPVERLGGARTQDEAEMALRYAQALKEQIRPLSQIQALYAGITQQAAEMQRIKALPDTAMLNAAGRGIKALETAQDKYNRELQESAERLQKLDRLEQARERRARKLQDIADYYGSPSAMGNAGFGVQAPAVPPGGVKRTPKTTGGRTAGKLFENLALGAGFPLLFGGGPGQVIGGLLGSFVGPGFGGQILGSALGGQLEQLGVAATEAGKALQKPIDNFGTIEQRALLASSSQERYVKQLIDAGQYIEATAAIQKRYNEVIGTQGSKDLLQLAKSSDLLSRTWGELNLQLQAAVAGPLAAVLQWINKVLKINITEPGKQAARLQDFMQNLSPEQRKEYFKRSMDLAARNKGVVDPRALQRLQEEMVPGFGAQAALVVGYQATEAQATASLERRREIQDQITKLRQAELSAAQAQLQQDVSILTKQQEFSLSLNQQYAIIDKIAAKKIESANLEYQQVQRTQQAEITNKQLALEVAKAKAIAAKEEIKQLDAAGKLTPLKQIELQAVIDKVFVAEKDLAITKEVAHAATQRAGADAQSVKYLTDIEARQQKVAAYAADAARQTEAFNRSANEAVNSLNNNLSVIQAYSQAQQTINNLQIQSLQSNLQLATSTSERLAILNKIRDLEILNAKIALNATRAQIKVEVERQRIALAMTEQKYKQLQADVAMAKAQGVLNQDHLEALANQKSALTIAVDNYNTSLKVANEQWRAADAVYEAAVRAADFKLSMEAASRSAQQTAAAATTTAEQTAAAANYKMGATATVRTKALPLTQKQLLEMKNRLGGTAGLSASYYGQNAETLAATKARSQQQQEAMAQQMADNLQRLRSTAAERSSGTAGPINIQTGPVLQQDGKKYVTLEDMESAIQSMASTMYSSNRAAGTRRYTGVR